MKKFTRISALTILLALSLAGCGAAPSVPETSAPSQEPEPVLYTNLTDDASRETVISCLQTHGISQERTDTLLVWADDFNSRVTAPSLPDGFVPMDGDFVDYSSLSFTYKELPDGTLFPEANCRLTAFLLLGDQIQTNGSANEADTFLMFDVEAIDTLDTYQLTPEARADFITLFNSVSVEGSDTIESHLACIQEAWNKRGLQIDSSGGLSLIEVYLHSPFDALRFVGHTGVLVETEDGLLFVEKYGPDGPFQATAFQNRKQLETYLLARPDLYGDDTELPPIVLENGAVLDLSR